MRFPIDAAPLASLAVIEAVEAEIGRPLPKDYRRLLLEVGNGGIVDWMALADDGVGWQRLLGVRAEPESRDLQRCLATFDGDIHPDFFPFGDTVAGDLVCISVRAKDEGSIWLWDHERRSRWLGRPTTRNMVFIAPTMEAFLNQDYPTVITG